MLGKPKELEGILLVDKPRGFTSHDVVARLRRKLAMKRIGHAGTLDPMATGLLIMLVGRATRISQYLTNLDKEYEGTIELGRTTNSQDADGEVMETRPVSALTEEQVRTAMQAFLGDQYQTPPMFSAIKIDGVPLYKKARRGEEVVREPRFIRVSAYELTRFALPHLDFRLRCSKGTYVRTLAHDLGQKLGCGAHLSALRRTATDKFRIDAALPLEEIERLPVPEIAKRLLPVYEVVPSFAA
ncbi:MAG: tRNA pseudouridine(55) synthase TruB [Opitutaceae bacterium]|nr:tRNA pseudouridine(55) synthase TruB [Opitutaceae bacterium]